MITYLLIPLAATNALLLARLVQGTYIILKEDRQESKILR